mmetsp:Transcript_31717/g.79754  ORF Transcript_31717/g.79754 Transcript_31717/m.79754 type:complete len:657 (+) Transcript_31717:3-1973(+)
MHAYEVKAQRLKATKKQMRAGIKDEGNLLFVDLLHWIKDVEEVPTHRLRALVEDLNLPRLCRPAAWGLSCFGCELSHGAKFCLWRGRQVAAKTPAWMRSPPHLPGLFEMTFEEVDALWLTAPDECKASMGNKVQFLTFDGNVIWGRDLGEDSGHAFRTFLSDMQAGVSDCSDLLLPPAAADVGPLAASCPEEAWHQVLTCLCLRETARAALAFLSCQAARISISHAWDAQALLPASWPRGLSGLRAFLHAAQTTHLAELVFSKIPRSRRLEECLEMNKLGMQVDTAITCGSVYARSVNCPAQPSALALSDGSRAWEGLLAIAVGREIKLVRRYDMGSCGTLSLRDRRTVGAMSLSSDSHMLAVAPVSETGRLASEIHFYSTTEAKAAPVIATCSEPVSSMDFLRSTCLGSAGAACDAVATWGTELSQVSSATGDIVACWRSDADRQVFSACQAASPHEAMTLAEQMVELWDVRTADGLVGSITTDAGSLTAMDATPFCNSGVVMLGDCLGGLLRIDWRRATSPEPLWNPPRDWGRSPPACNLMVDRGCACVITMNSLTILALEPCVVTLGCAGKIGAVASVPGAWALAGQDRRPAVVVVEPCSRLQRRANDGVKAETDNGGSSRKAAKMYRKSELNGHGQHARGAGKNSRSGRRGR